MGFFSNRLSSALASTTLKAAPNERNFFAIYVIYYIKVRLIVNGIGGDVSCKIPFTLMREGPELDDGSNQQLLFKETNEHQPQQELKTNKPEQNNIN